MRSWIDVATLAKTKSLDGRFVARAAAGLPFLMEPGDEVAFVPPQLDAPRRALVIEAREIGDRTAEIAFEGVDASAAHALVGCHCLMRREAIDTSTLEDTPVFWDGLRVVDKSLGDIGVVSNIVENPAHALIDVMRDDGSNVLVPAVDEIVEDVDFETGVMRVTLPKGLLDL